MIYFCAALVLLLYCVAEYFLAPFRRVRPHIYPGHGPNAILYPWTLRYILVTHESGWVFKRRYGVAFETEAEAEKAQILRVKKDLELNDMLASIKSEVEARK